MLQTELELRHDKIRALMEQQNIDAALITCNANLFYTCGQVVIGYLYLPVHAPSLLFVKRPNTISGTHRFSIRKPEQIVDLLQENNLPLPSRLMLESDELPYSEHIRLAALFPEAEIVNGSSILREARSVKTPYEIELFRRSAALHAKVYKQIPQLYRPGMTDIGLSVEIERLMRLEGALGLYRIFGRTMEVCMGSLLAGDNAAAASPYDFALGGEGMDESLPVGANGTLLKEGNSVLVDMNGNFYGYMCDMSRVYSVGRLSDRAYTAHRVCLDVQDKIASAARPGITGEELYELAMGVVRKSGFADNFMGITQQARFIGHGVGLEINELPVLAPRMKQELQPGMVFALEPKIVLPETGAVGIENSWLVTETGVEKLTLCEEDILELK